MSTSGARDTRPEAAAVHRDLLQRASPTKRASLALSLSQSVCGLARRAIAAREPALSGEEVGLRFVELHYGAALARAVREDLRRRRAS